MDQLTEARLQALKQAYFIGIGGIGMSALAQYFKRKGLRVAGYDRTPSAITATLSRLGISVIYEDNPLALPENIVEPSPETLIVYTPAVPDYCNIVRFLRAKNHHLFKRAEVLGRIADAYEDVVAVAGTHGKTTTSTMIAYILANTIGCDAMLGGISANYSSNLVLANRKRSVFVTEADEYDRSFLQLNPNVSVITSVAPDHLDIYGSFENLVEAYRDFALNNRWHQILVHGTILPHFRHLGLFFTTYGFEGDYDYSGKNLHYKGSRPHYTLKRQGYPDLEVSLGVPGFYNVENSIAAIAAAEMLGVPAEKSIPLLADFKGVERRFDVHIDTPTLMYVDDYAHHPDELAAIIRGVREIAPGRKITGIFQPHLYSRTQALAHDFVYALSPLDTILLLPIYPAREEPIEGVSSEMLLRMLPASIRKTVVPMDQLLDMLNILPLDVVVTMGAGDIGTMVPKVIEYLKGRM